MIGYIFTFILGAAFGILLLLSLMQLDAGEQ